MTRIEPQRQYLSHGRVLVYDGGAWLLYDRLPGGLLGSAHDNDDPETLEAFMALVARYQ